MKEQHRELIRRIHAFFHTGQAYTTSRTMPDKCRASLMGLDRLRHCPLISPKLQSPSQRPRQPHPEILGEATTAFPGSLVDLMMVGRSKDQSEEPFRRIPHLYLGMYSSGWRKAAIEFPTCSKSGSTTCDSRHENALSSKLFDQKVIEFGIIVAIIVPS